MMPAAIISATQAPASSDVEKPNRTGRADPPRSAPGFADYRDRTRSFSSVAVETWWQPNLTGDGDPERLVTELGLLRLLAAGYARIEELPAPLAATVAKSAEGSINPQYGIRGGFPYGGVCLPKDTCGFLGFADSVGVDMPLLRAVVSVNEHLEKVVSSEVEAVAGFGPEQKQAETRGDNQRQRSPALDQSLMS